MPTEPYGIPREAFPWSTPSTEAAQREVSTVLQGTAPDPRAAGLRITGPGAADSEWIGGVQVLDYPQRYLELLRFSIDITQKVGVGYCHKASKRFLQC
jgi:hypothetical protein